MDPTEELIAFWQRCPLDGPTLCHPEDWTTLHCRQDSWDGETLSYTEFIAKRRSTKFSDTLHLSLVPVPFLGDLRRADVLILLLNPGFNLVDHWLETHSEYTRNRIKANLRQELGGIEFPFMGLDPQFCHHPGFTWWEERLHAIVSHIAREIYKGSYIDALRDLSTRLAAIELVPYHSQNFNGKGFLLKKLASTSAARKFARAICGDKKKTIIVIRGTKHWDIGSSDNICVYDGRRRGIDLSTGSPGGRAILRQYGI